MMSLAAAVLPTAVAATAQPQRRTPSTLAPCRRPTAQPAALSCRPSGAGLASAAAAPSRRGRVLLRASAGGGGGSDLESEGLEQQSFSSLAKAVANKLASEVAGQEGTYNRLKLWLDQAAAPAKRAVEEGAKGNVGAAKEERKQAKGVLGKAASLAASALGVSGFMKGAGGEESPAAAAARALGADGVTVTLDAVKNWLTSPHRKGDVQMVGALVYKMLSFLEHETGEKFEGKDHQYQWVSRLAMEVFGGSMTSRVVRALVDAYLRAPSRGL